MNERLKMLINYLTVNLLVKSNADFASKVDIAKSQLSEILGNKRKMPKNLVNKIHTAFPDVNINWLTEGQGEMFGNSVIQNNKNGDNIQGASVTIHKAEGDYLEIIKGLTSQLSKSQEQVSKSQEQIDRLITIIENRL